MTVKIKDWARFQHFKDRKPPWIKLYRDILDDIEWHELNGDDAKTLVMLWVIASESDGVLPSFKELAFRLRSTEKSIKSIVSRLGHWLVQDDIGLISDARTISGRYQDDDGELTEGYQNGIPMKALTRSQETERETETESAFAQFWSAYPKKTAKPAAQKAFRTAKVNGHLGDVLADIAARSSGDDWAKEGGKYIPNPATYLNQRRWEDGAPELSGIGTFL